MQPNTENIKQLINLFQLTGRTEKEVRETAEIDLKKASQLLGFKVCLFQIIVTPSVPPAIRVSAAIYFKNTVERSWRRSPLRHEQSPDEKEHEKEKVFLKSKLLVPFGEKIPQVGKQLAVTVANVAAVEWPKNWEELFPHLIGAIQKHSDSVPHQTQALSTLQQVLKKLTGKKIYRTEFEKVGAVMLPFLKYLWKELTGKFFKNAKEVLSKSPSKEAVTLLTESAEQAKLSLKCLHWVVVYGTSNVGTNKEINALFNDMLIASQNMMALRGGLPDGSLKKCVTTMILLIGKTAIDTQKEHPLHFGPYLPMFIKHFSEVLKKSFSESEELIFEEWTVQALVFLSRIFSTMQYYSKHEASGVDFSGGKIVLDSQGAEKVKEILNTVFTSQNICALFQLLVTQFIPLRVADLKQWESNPEQFIEDEAFLRIDDRIRPATVNLCRLILQKYTQPVGPMILTMMNDILSAYPPTKAPSIDTPYDKMLYRKEAIYTVFGVGPQELSGAFKEKGYDFAKLYGQILSKEIHTKAPSLKCIRRRAIHSIGEWVDWIPNELRKNIYQDILNLLQESDLVVRFAAAYTLRILVDHIHFEDTVDDFVKIGVQLLEQLFKLISDAKELDSRTPILDVIAKVVEHVGPKIRPCVNMLASALTRLWSACEEQNILRVPILAILKYLINAVGPDSRHLHTFIIPTLSYCTDTSEKVQLARSYLYEQAFEVWHATIQNASIYTPELNGLFKNWLGFFDTSVQHLEVAMLVLESYLLLGRGEFIKTYGKTVANVLNELMKNELNDKGLKRVLPVLETFAQLYPAEFPLLFRSALENMCKELDVIAHGEKKIKQNKAAVGYVHVFARLFFQNFQGIMGTMLKMENGSQMIGSLLTVWFDKFDDILEPYKKKLSALALINFLDTKEPSILKELGQIIHCATLVLIEAEDNKSSSYLPESKFMKPEEQTESNRYQALVSQDPATRINVRDYLTEKMKQLSTALGPEAWTALMKTVDPVILQEFEKHAKSKGTPR